VNEEGKKTGVKLEIKMATRNTSIGVNDHFHMYTHMWKTEKKEEAKRGGGGGRLGRKMEGGGGENLKLTGCRKQGLYQFWKKQKKKNQKNFYWGVFGERGYIWLLPRATTGGG